MSTHYPTTDSSSACQAGEACLNGVRNAVLKQVPGLQRSEVALVRQSTLPHAVWSKLESMGDVVLRTPGGQKFVYRSQPDDMFARSLAWGRLHSSAGSEVRSTMCLSSAANRSSGPCLHDKSLLRAF